MFAALYRLISTDETPSSVSLHALGFEPRFDVDRDDEKSRRQTSEEVDELGGKPSNRNADTDQTDNVTTAKPEKPDWTFPLHIIRQRTAVVSSDENLLLDVSPSDAIDDEPDGVPPDVKPLLGPRALSQKLLQGFIHASPDGRIDARRLSERAASHRNLLPLPRRPREQPVQQFWLLIEHLPELAWDVDHLQEQLSLMPVYRRPLRQIRLSDDASTWLDEHDELHSSTALPRIPEVCALLVVADPSRPSQVLLTALRRVIRRNTHIVWLSPRPQSNSKVIYWGRKTHASAQDKYWDDRDDLPSVEYGASDAPSTTQNKIVEQMKTLLWPFHPITPALGRECRLLLGGSTADEQTFWRSIARDPSDLLNGQCSIGELEQRKHYFKHIGAWFASEPDKVRGYYEQLQPHIDAMNATFRHRVMLNLPVELVDSESRRKAELFFALLAVKANNSPTQDTETHRHLCAVILQMAQGLVTRESEKLGAVIEAGQQGYRQYDPQAAMLDNRASAALDRAAVSDGFLVATDKGLLLNAEKRAGVIASLSYSEGGIAVETQNRKIPTLVQLNEPLPASTCTLHTAKERIEIVRLDSQRFYFAESLWQDSEGVHLITQENLRIDYPVGGGGPVFITTDAPDWLQKSTLGIDDYGLCAQLDIMDVPVIMRWIAPGRFHMGSPEDEAEREDDEQQHWVTLTQGYWLAESTCTQQLWEAVMGENPSGFKGAERPVENVSWEDVQRFVQAVKGDAGIDLELPTEAQWEYACRAGTEGPFNLGQTINTEEVNYDGNHPYGGAPKGEYREETVDTRLFKPNDWSLYQMHGNVWEWCSDWYENYAEEEQFDPKGPEAGVTRVLRGGSWIRDARYCRSAYRRGDVPSTRGRDIGFRFAQLTGAPASAERSADK